MNIDTFVCMEKMRIFTNTDTPSSLVLENIAVNKNTQQIVYFFNKELKGLRWQISFKKMLFIWRMLSIQLYFERGYDALETDRA